MKQPINDTKRVLLVDGYNVIYRLSQLSAKKGVTLEEKRRRLAAFMLAWKKTTKYKGSIYLVFDGNDSQITTLEQTSLHGIKCIYSRQKEEADGKIIGIIRIASHPENITVISDDNYIANNVRSYGAYIKPVSSLVESRTKGKRNSGTAGDKRIDTATANHITEHMKKIWNVTD
ncbi:NYN domain-containing protein [Candidatus Omnitrophota bacterium]